MNGCASTTFTSVATNVHLVVFYVIQYNHIWIYGDDIVKLLVLQVYISMSFNFRV